MKLQSVHLQVTIKTYTGRDFKIVLTKNAHLIEHKSPYDSSSGDNFLSVFSTFNSNPSSSCGCILVLTGLTGKEADTVIARAMSLL